MVAAFSPAQKLKGLLRKPGVPVTIEQNEPDDCITQGK